MTPVKNSKALERYLDKVDRWFNFAIPDGGRYITRKAAADFLRNVPDDIIDILREYVEDDNLPPNMDDLKEWCAAALWIRPYLERRLAMDTSDYDTRRFEI